MSKPQDHLAKGGVPRTSGAVYGGLGRLKGVKFNTPNDQGSGTPATEDTPTDTPTDTPAEGEVVEEVVEETSTLSEELQASIASDVMKGLAPVITKTVTDAIKTASIASDTPNTKGVNSTTTNAGAASNEETMGKSFGTRRTQASMEADGVQLRTLKAVRALMKNQWRVVDQYNDFAAERRQKAYETETDLRLKAAFQTGDEDLDGGVLLLEPEVEKEISRLEPQYGVALTDCDVRPVNSRFQKVNRGLDNIQMFPKAEGAIIKGTKSTYESALVELREWAGIGLVTDELLDDQAVDIFADITKGFARANALIADTLLFTEIAGSGYQGGILNFDDGIYAESVGSSLATISWDSLMNLETKLLTESTVGAKWYMHRTVWNKLRQTKSAEDGHYLFLPDGTKVTPDSGIEIRFSEILPAYEEGVNNKAYAVFGNLDNCVFYTKGGLELAYSNQASVPDADDNIVHTWANGMTAVRGISRMDKYVKHEGNFGLLGTGGVS